MKLFVSDYDMTLAINRVVDDKVINAIKKWREKGNIFAIATGRNKFSILEQTYKNNIEVDYIIANNGALIIDRNNNILLKEEIEKNNAMEVINYLYNEYEGSVEISNENEILSIIPRKGEHNLPFKVDRKITIEEAKNISNIIQINKMSPDVNTTEIIQDEINNKFDTVIAYGNITAIDIVRRNISKATGIQNLENILKDKNIEKILVAGDSNNDIDMIKKYDEGYKVVLATRADREEPITQKMFSNLYAFLMRKLALHNMPKGGFDSFLIDRQVINLLVEMQEKNTSLMSQILWAGFETTTIPYVRKKREIGKSRWTLSKKIKLVYDSLLSFSYFPVKLITTIGFLTSLLSLILLIVIVCQKITGKIDVEGYTSLVMIMLMGFGVIMLSIGIIGEYLWRTYDAARKRPPYIIEKVEKGENGQNGK